MTEGFKNFMLRDVERLTGDQRRDFLRTLKFDPAFVERFIFENIMDWITSFMISSQKEAILCNDLKGDSRLLRIAYEQHFAEELALITQ